MIVLEKEYFTTDEVAERLKVDKETVLRWIRAKRLKAMRLGSKMYRISPTDLTDFIADNYPQEDKPEDTVKG